MTAEVALCLPALVLLLAALTWAVGVVSAQVRCVDAAGIAARAAARGDAPDAARALGRSAAPSGAQVHVVVSGGWARVQVRARLQAPGVLGSVWEVPVGAHAEVPLEPIAQSTGSHG